MMPIGLQCQCGRTLRVRDDTAGKKVRCPDCRGVIPVPGMISTGGSSKAELLSAPDRFGKSTPYLEVKLHETGEVRYCASREALVDLFNEGTLAKRDEARWADPDPSGIGRLHGPWQPMKDFVDHDKFFDQLAKTRQKMSKRKGKTGPAGPEIGDESKAPVAIRLKPGEASFLEVLLKNNKVKTFGSLDELRDQLLSGKLTRHSKARWIEPKPDRAEYLARGVAWEGETVATWDLEKGGLAQKTLTKDEASDATDHEYREQRSKWRTRRKWRRIGDGIAKEENSIKVLYEPFSVSLERVIPFLAWSGGVMGAIVGLGIGLFAFGPLFLLTYLVVLLPGAGGLIGAAAGWILAYPVAWTALQLIPVKPPPDDGFAD